MSCTGFACRQIRCLARPAKRQQKGFAFANCTALRQWLAHEPDGRRMQGEGGGASSNELKYCLGTGTPVAPCQGATRFDVWLKTEACLSFFKDANDVKMWMDDFGEASNDIYIVLEMKSNQILGDFFRNLPKLDIEFLSHGGPKTGYCRKGFSQTGSRMTVETMKRNLSKVMPFPFSVHLLLLHNAIICNDMYQDSEGKHYEILLGR